MKIQRPPAEKRKIHSRNEFELCYLRHQYVRRVDYNPTQADMAPYMAIITQQAKNTYYTYLNLFKLAGFEIEDLINICMVHLVSFLGLFALEKDSKKYADFIVAHKNKYDKKPSWKDKRDKNKANLTLFMKQRMEDVVRVCRQKARNIKGMATEDFYIYYGVNPPPDNARLLLEDHEKYGYRKLDHGSFKAIKKKENIKDNSKPFKFAGFWYIAVELEKRNLTLLDFSGAGLDPYDSIHNKNPEELLFDRLKEEEYDKNKKIFNSHSNQVKEGILKSFILKNKDNPLFKEEIQIAMNFIKDLDI